MDELEFVHAGQPWQLPSDVTPSFSTSILPCLPYIDQPKRQDHKGKPL